MLLVLGPSDLQGTSFGWRDVSRNGTRQEEEEADQHRSHLWCLPNTPLKLRARQPSCQGALVSFKRLFGGDPLRLEPRSLLANRKERIALKAMRDNAVDVVIRVGGVPVLDYEGQG